MNETYFVFTRTEDSFCCEILDAKTITSRIGERYYGDIPVLDTWPRERDIDCWPLGICIVKGSVVVPKAVQTVTEYVLP